MVTIGQIGDTEVVVRRTESRQEILIQATDVGQALARLLGNGGVRREGDYLLLAHDCAVDERLKQMADVVITLRYAHPAFTRITLVLGGGDDEGATS